MASYSKLFPNFAVAPPPRSLNLARKPPLPAGGGCPVEQAQAWFDWGCPAGSPTTRRGVLGGAPPEWTGDPRVSGEIAPPASSNFADPTASSGTSTSQPQRPEDRGAFGRFRLARMRASRCPW